MIIPTTDMMTIMMAMQHNIIYYHCISSTIINYKCNTIVSFQINNFSVINAAQIIQRICKAIIQLHNPLIHLFEWL